jgi:hypothetical protein
LDVWGYYSTYFNELTISEGRKIDNTLYYWRCKQAVNRGFSNFKRQHSYIYLNLKLDLNLTLYGKLVRGFVSTCLYYQQAGLWIVVHSWHSFQMPIAFKEHYNKKKKYSNIEKNE